MSIMAIGFVIYCVYPQPLLCSGQNVFPKSMQSKHISKPIHPTYMIFMPGTKILLNILIEGKALFLFIDVITQGWE